MSRVFVALLVIFLGLVFGWRLTSLSLEPQEEKVENPITGAIREKSYANINQLLPAREASLVSGMVLGIDEINYGFKEALVKTGTIHAVVVSGQNLTIVAGFFMAIAKFVGRRKSLVLAVIFSFLYAILTGFEPPVIRASLMVLATCGAVLFGRQIAPLWTLVLVAAVIIFVSPSAVFDISFQLTFAATLGIITLGKGLSRKWGKLPVIGENAAIATSAYLFTAPVIIFYFGRVSLLSPLVNLIVAEAVLPTMVFGFLAVIFGFIFEPISRIFAFFAYAPALFFASVVSLFANVDFGQVELGKKNLFALLLLYFFTFSMISIWLRKTAR